MNIIKKKIHSIRQCVRYGEWDKLVAGLLGKKISLLSNTLKPQRYRYIMLASHGSGRNAFWHFMDMAGAHPMRKFDIAAISRTCFFGYRKIWGIVCDRDINHCDGGKYFVDRLSKKVPVFCLVRDPISIVRGGINMALADIIMGGGKATTNALIKDTLLSYLESYAKMPHHFIFTTSPNQFKHITKELIYIDMSELSKENAYTTIKRCCDKIGIKSIDMEEEFFTRKIADSLSLNIEKDMRININGDTINIKVLPFENTLHKRFGDIYTFDDTNLGRKIAICLPSKKRLSKEAKDSIQAQVRRYLADLSARYALYEKSKIGEDDVLEYFKHDRIMHEKFREILAYEVSNVKKVAPNIVESWAYYEAFTKYHA